MEPERWRKIEEIYHAALEREERVAGDALMGLATMSVLSGESISADLAFARQQQLAGAQHRALALLEAVLGDSQVAEQSLRQYAATRPWLSPIALQGLDAHIRSWAALLHNDGQAALAATSGLPDLLDPWLPFGKGRAYALVKDYTHAQQQLLRVRNLAPDNEDRASLLEALAHFYLAQVCEATGRRDQAVQEYQNFLSSFENPPATLSQVTEARAALERLR